MNHMNRREHNEISRWRTQATKYKKELDDLIKEKLTLKNEDRKYLEQIAELKKEIEEYKRELNKTKEPKATLGQKMVLLHHFGIIEYINRFDIDQTDKYKLLSYILDAHEKSIAPVFNTSLKFEDSPLNNVPNNKFLIKTFQEFKMSGPEKEAQERLDKLQEKRR